MDFFFSSRRRHTRYWRDWSSDVCSSDLLVAIDHVVEGGAVDEVIIHAVLFEIGRAACRERVEISGAGVTVNKNTGQPTRITITASNFQPHRTITRSVEDA